MENILKRVTPWLRAHPHTMVALAAGLLLGVAICLPLGWKLPDPVAAILGAAIGAGAAVGGALWAANAKQSQEDAKADERRRQVAHMIAAAIASEISLTHNFLAWQAEQLRSAIPGADISGSGDRVRELFANTKVSAEMCRTFLERLDVFGSDTPVVVGVVSSILEFNPTNESIADLLETYNWKSARGPVVTRLRAIEMLVGNFTAGMKVLVKHHPYGDKIMDLLEVPTAKEAGKK